jgi:hypothetical protein
MVSDFNLEIEWIPMNVPFQVELDSYLIFICTTLLNRDC